jgi:hypothetical protein
MWPCAGAGFCPPSPMEKKGRYAGARRVSLGRPWLPAHAGTRGSPFQMPARLADGLGPESDLAMVCHRVRPAPVFRGFGSPRADLQEGKAA